MPQAQPVDAAHLRAAIGMEFEEPFTLKLLERITHRLDAHAEALGERLQPEPGAGRVLPATMSARRLVATRL